MASLETLVYSDSIFTVLLMTDIVLVLLIDAVASLANNDVVLTKFTDL